MLVGLMVLYGLGSTGCVSASGSSESGECSQEIHCPSLSGAPCHNGTNPPVYYYYCDPCGHTWFCADYNDLGESLQSWGYSDYLCECITGDYTIDTGNPACRDTY